MYCRFNIALGIESPAVPYTGVPLGATLWKLTSPSNVDSSMPRPALRSVRSPQSFFYAVEPPKGIKCVEALGVK